MAKRLAHAPQSESDEEQMEVKYSKGVALFLKRLRFFDESGEVLEQMLEELDEQGMEFKSVIKNWISIHHPELMIALNTSNENAVYYKECYMNALDRAKEVYLREKEMMARVRELEWVIMDEEKKTDLCAKAANVTDAIDISKYLKARRPYDQVKDAGMFKIFNGKSAQKVLTQTDWAKTVYETYNLWGMEEIYAKIKQDGHEAKMCKDWKRAKGLESAMWVVISNEPYETWEPPADHPSRYNRVMKRAKK
jgi:hypothetical protein